MAAPEELRRQLVEHLLREGYVRDPRVAAALQRVPRHLFLDASPEASYADRPLAIGQEQTISAPHMVAMMADALDAQPGQRVLEVGAGSGYHAAVVAELVAPRGPAGEPLGARGKVWSIERFADLAARARQNLRHAGCGPDRVEVVEGDGSEGLPAQAPFDRIYLTCAAPRAPPPLRDQLAERGKLLAPLGGLREQELVLLEREGAGWAERRLGACVFVPLVGRWGFRQAPVA